MASSSGLFCLYKPRPHKSSLSRRNQRPSHDGLVPSPSRGRREGRVLAAPMAPVREEVHGAGTTGLAGASRPSLRDGLRLIRALLGDRLSCPHVATTRKRVALGISTGMPGPHDFTVRIDAIRPTASTRPPHPAPDVRDDAYAPSVRRDGEGLYMISGKKKGKILAREPDRAQQIEDMVKFVCCAQVHEPASPAMCSKPPRTMSRADRLAATATCSSKAIAIPAAYPEASPDSGDAGGKSVRNNA